MKGNDLRKGRVIMYKGAPHQVMDYQHRTPGNLRAFVQTTLRNVLTGSQCEARFSSTEELDVADMYTFKGTFLYADGFGYHFMNSQNYEEVMVTDAVIGDKKYFLLDGMEVELSTFEGTPISVSLPKTAVVTIADAPPEFKGATATNAPKPAVTESGWKLSIPNFVNIGDKVVVDTDTGEYLNRA
ncbi:MAG: elongation factor P [Candidatus Omnitrophota bacterium]|jgi:elongation factor P|nr:MAG: elongation factor P [Candidatus Omnitrophota bacterium]